MKTQTKVAHIWLRFQLFNFKAAPLLLLWKFGYLDSNESSTTSGYTIITSYFILWKYGGVRLWDCSIRTKIEIAFQNFPFLFSNSSIHFYRFQQYLGFTMSSKFPWSNQRSGDICLILQTLQFVQSANNMCVYCILYWDMQTAWHEKLYQRVP